MKRSSLVPENAPKPPFVGSKVLMDVTLNEIVPYLNKNVLFKARWGIKKGKLNDKEYLELLNTELEPALMRMIALATEENLIQPSLVYSYYYCNSTNEKLFIYEDKDSDKPIAEFGFPRQMDKEFLSLCDYFEDVSSGKKDVVGFFVVSVGEKASEKSNELFSANLYKDYLYWHGFSVELAEAFAEYWHLKMRNELHINKKDSANVAEIVQCRYHGRRYSFGYPACPDLDQQKILFSLMDAGRIGVALSEEMQMVPEQSVSAIVVHHSKAEYFAV